MPEYMELATKAERQVISALKQAQEIALSAVSAVTDTVAPLAENLPSMPFAGSIPAPAAIIKNAFGFADELLKLQKSYALSLAETLQPLTAKVAAENGTTRRSSTKASA